MNKIKEFHLFAGIGGGIYGGKLLGHKCCGSVEIDNFCNAILKQRQMDGWLEPFEIYGDILKINGKDFIGKFDILCGGFPCQAFSHAAHGKNIIEKNLWSEMLRFIIESEAPIVFGENVTSKAINSAKVDLENRGYKVQKCKVSCGEIGGDHRRDRYWLLAVKDDSIFKTIVKHSLSLPKLKANCWTIKIDNSIEKTPITNKRAQLKALGNAQSPFAAATAFRILVNRHLNNINYPEIVSSDEIGSVFEIQTSWIKSTYGNNFGYVHTPTTMANYAAPSMMKHQGCRNFVTVFGKPTPANAEYLMGFPKGASTLSPMSKENYYRWNK